MTKSLEELEADLAEAKTQCWARAEAWDEADARVNRIETEIEELEKDNE